MNTFFSATIRSFATTQKSGLKGSAKQWMKRHVNDPYVKQARLQKYRSRSAFKLLEINTRFNLFRPGMRVIDVGAAPGGWSQIIAEKVESEQVQQRPENAAQGPETVVAVDLLEMAPIPGVKIVQGNISEEKTQERISEMLDFKRADLVCSDAVPDFMGDRFVDHMRATRLNKEIVDFCQLALRPGGNLLMKIIQGPAEKELSEFATMRFKKLQKVKPSASRNESAETYYLCQGFEQSLDPAAVRDRQRIEAFELAKDDPVATQELVQELEAEGLEDLKNMIAAAHQHGLDVPDKLKAQLKGSFLGAQLDLENRMSAREKAAAKAKLEEKEANELFDRTGIRDKSADWTLDNMVNEYEYEMARQELQKEKKSKKRQGRRSDDIDPETGKPRERNPEQDRTTYGSDDDVDREYEEIAKRYPKFATKEFQEHLQKKKESREKLEELYGDDEPYDAPVEEQRNDEEQRQYLHDKLAKLAKEEAKAEATEEPTPEEEETFLKAKETIAQYQSMMEDMALAEAEDHFAASQEYDEKRLAEELSVLEQLEDTEMKRSESKYQKQSVRQSVRRRGGLKPESPFFDDD